jgi:hypothetical protein
MTQLKLDQNNIILESKMKILCIYFLICVPMENREKTFYLTIGLNLGEILEVSLSFTFLSIKFEKLLLFIFIELSFLSLVVQCS